MKPPLSALAALFAMAAAWPAAHAQEGGYGMQRGSGAVICDGDEDKGLQPDDPSYAASQAWDRIVFGEAGAPCRPQLTELDAGTWLQSAPFQGADAEGRTARFRLYVLHDTYSWSLGSSVDLEHEGAPADPSDIFRAPNFLARFCAANAAFGFGAASYEGATAANNAMAGQRARTIAGALTNVREACDPGRIPILFAVNLGEFADDNGCAGAQACRKESARQRRVVIVAADEITLGVDLPEALRKGVEDQNVFDGLDVDRYALFDIESF